MNPTQIQPRNAKILLHAQKPEGSIIHADALDSPDAKLIVAAIAPDVTCCAVGDHVILRPNTNLIATPLLPDHVLCDATAVVAVIANV